MFHHEHSKFVRYLNHMCMNNCSLSKLLSSIKQSINNVALNSSLQFNVLCAFSEKYMLFYSEMLTAFEF